MTWINNDGLEVKFGTDEAAKRNLGEYNQLGPVHITELMVKVSELPALATTTIISEAHKLPSGAKIEYVEFVSPSTTFASALTTATLDIGIIDLDGTSNADDTALVAAATEAELSAGGKNIAGWVGTAIGFSLARPSLITWTVNVEVFTGGEGVLRIGWSVDKVDAETLVYVK